MTQIESARQGTITPEMEYVARRESLDAETGPVGSRPGADGHPGQSRVTSSSACSRWRSASRPKCKINANIGNSAVTSDVDNELAKLKMAVDLGSDTVMDLSTGGDIDAIRRAIIAASPVPIGTVPMYQAIQKVKKRRGPHRAGPARHGRAPGQAGGRLHDDPRGDPARLHPADRAPDHRDRLAGRLADGPVDGRARQARTRSTPGSTTSATSCGQYDVTFSLGDSLRPGSIADASDAPSSPS